MRMSVIVLFVSVFLCHTCYGYIIDGTDSYYQNEIEPKLDILCRNIKQKATEIIRGREPLYEVELTQEERYFSSESMEFYTGEVGLPARYSEVKKLAVWRYGLTVISGWTYDGENYHVNYVYTRDARFEPVAGIHAFGNASELEKYFHGSLYDISAEYGSVGHLSAVFANDDWSAVCVLVSYSGKGIKSIEAWDDNAYGDKVPVVPQSERMKEYISGMVRRIDWEAEHSLDLALQEIQTQKGLPSSTEAENHDTSLVLKTVWIVMLSLSVGVVLLLLLVVIYRKLGTRPPTRVLVNASVPRQEKMGSPGKEEDYIDVEYVEISKLKDTE